MLKSIFSLVFVFAAVTASADDCKKLRGAVDMGSGSTKIKVARVDLCSQRILELLYKASASVNYLDDVNTYQQYKQEFSPEIQKKGIEVLKKLQADALKALAEKGVSAEEIKEIEYDGVATEAFRQALKNGKQFIETVQHEIGVKMRIISQKEEAVMGFLGAAAHVSQSYGDLVVWDIGGGSMQITALKKAEHNNQDWLFYAGKVASKTFKDLYLAKVDPSHSLVSPNPMGKKNAQTALELAGDLAGTELTKEIKAKLKSNDVEVLGIGGVFTDSLKETFTVENGAQYVTQKSLENEIQRQSLMNDQELGGSKFVDTEVTNMILVFEFMKKAKIDKVRVVPVNLADAVLLGFDPNVN